MHKKGLIPLVLNPGGIGKHGGHHTFFHNGFQKQILASQNGAGVPAIYCFHCGKPGFYEFTRMPFGLCNALTIF